MQPILAHSALHAAFAEPDSGVQNALWPSLMALLKSHPDAWTQADADDHEDDSSDEDGDLTNNTEVSATSDSEQKDDNEPQLPPVVVEMLSFLQLACRGNPIASYPVLVLLLASMPISYIVYDRTTLDAIFSSFWAAFDGKALEPHDTGGKATIAFVEALLECTVLLSGRAKAAGFDALASFYLTDHCERVWREVLGQGLMSRTKAAQIQQACVAAISMTAHRTGQIDYDIFAAMRRSTFEVIDSNVEAPGLGTSCAQLAKADKDRDLGQRFMVAVFDRIVDSFARHEPSACRLRDMQTMMSDPDNLQTLMQSSGMQVRRTFVHYRGSDSETKAASGPCSLANVYYR